MLGPQGEAGCDMKKVYRRAQKTNLMLLKTGLIIMERRTRGVDNRLLPTKKKKSIIHCPNSSTLVYVLFSLQNKIQEQNLQKPRLVDTVKYGPAHLNRP